MTPWTRRSFLVAAGSGGLVACTSTPPGAGLSAREKIDRDVDEALAELYSERPRRRRARRQRPGHPGHPAASARPASSPPAPTARAR